MKPDLAPEVTETDLRPDSTLINMDHHSQGSIEIYQSKKLLKEIEVKERGLVCLEEAVPPPTYEALTPVPSSHASGDHHHSQTS